MYGRGEIGNILRCCRANRDAKESEPSSSRKVSVAIPCNSADAIDDLRGVVVARAETKVLEIRRTLLARRG